MKSKDSQFKLQESLLSPAVQEVLFALPAQARIFVGYSGGVDSTVLLYLLCQLLPERVKNGFLIAVHIHHGLQQDADYFERHARQQARALNLSYQSFHLKLEIPRGESLEAYARKARYDRLNACLTGKHDVLILGHHLDDQAETFLLQALRGGGVAALAAMPMLDSARRYYRPLLQVSKQELINFAKKQGLSWVEDQTNRDLHFDRNFLRHEIFPRLLDHFPGAIKTLARAADHCGQAYEQLKSSVDPELKRVGGPRGGECILDLTSLDLSQPSLAQWIIKSWLNKQGVFVSTVSLMHIWTDMVCARPDASPSMTLGAYTLKKFAGQLFCLKSNALHESPYDYAWGGDQPLYLPGWSYALTLEKLAANGLNTAALDWTAVRVCSRRGGERCHPVGRVHSQSLKKLFQEYKIPPWRREVWPLIYCNNQIVCVLDLFVCQGFEQGSLLAK